MITRSGGNVKYQMNVKNTNKVRKKKSKYGSPIDFEGAIRYNKTQV